MKSNLDNLVASVNKVFLKKVILTVGILFAMLPNADAQCLVSTYDISTALDNSTGSPVLLSGVAPDPKWQVSDRTSGFGLTTGFPIGATVVNYSGYSLTTPWAGAGWISDDQNHVNPGVTATEDDYITFRRDFQICGTGNINFSLQFLSDNYVNGIYIDGVLQAGTIQTPGPTTYTTWWPVSFSITGMTSGIHTFEVRIQSTNTSPTGGLNPSGFAMVGNITSASSIIVNDWDPQCATFDCTAGGCNNTCYWRVEGNNILNGNNIFGTRSNNHVRIITNNPSANVAQDRGIITNNGLLGWNLNTTNMPTALFDVDCNGNNTQASGQSDIRFRSLETNGSNSLNLLGIDANGFVFNTGKSASTTNKWDLAGNTISAADFLGTINNEDIRFRTYSIGSLPQSSSQRMVIKGSAIGMQNDPMAGYVGINTPAPTARLHVDCVNGNGDPNGDPNNPAAALSDIRFQGLETTASPLTVLGIDANGYVYNTNRSLPPTTVQNSWNFVGNPAPSNSIFGITTVTGQDIQIHSDGSQRGVIDHNGNFGWNLGAGGLPTTYMHVNAAGVNAPPTGSGVRFENLQSNEGSIVVIDKDGYVYDSRLNINDMQGVKNNCGTIDMVPKFDASGNLTCSQIFDDPSGGVGIGSTGPFTYSAGLYYNGTSNSGGALALDVAGVTQSLEYIATSDKNYKSNITSIKNPFAIINNLHGKTYTWNDKAKAELKADNGKHYGFIAQEVAEVMPEAVVVNEKGRYGVNYNSMIPLLTEGQKELYKALEEEKAKNVELYNKLQELEGKINQLLISKNDMTVADKTADAAINELYQNSPNPFGKETSIGYNIVNMQQGAYIAVYDLNGKELFRQAVAEKGKGSVTVSGEKLVPGMYLYSLIVDGKETATKRMVVTK